MQVAAGEERLLRRSDDHADDLVTFGLEPIDGRGHRLTVSGVHRVRRLVRIVQREDDDAVRISLPADHGPPAHFWIASTTVAMPMPPPMHSVARPYLPPIRCSSSI